jgi:putative glycerol-1-phosphate prenyltransferase
MLGNKLIYLERVAAPKISSFKMINLVAQNIAIPLLVGGGIMDLQGIQNAYDAGADLVVIGTAFENNIHFFDKIKNIKYK